MWALQGLEERAIGEPEHSPSVSDQVSADAVEGSDEAGGDISGYLGRAPDQPEEEGEEELTDDDEMFAQFVQNYHESPATTPSKPRQVARAAPAPAPLQLSVEESQPAAADSGVFRPVSPKAPGSEAGGGFVRAISLSGVPVSPLPSRLSPQEAIVPTGAVAEVTARLPGLKGQSDWVGIRAYSSCDYQ